MNDFPKNYIMRRGKVYDLDQVEQQAAEELSVFRAEFESMDRLQKNGWLSKKQYADELLKVAASHAGRYVREDR